MTTTLLGRTLTRLLVFSALWVVGFAVRLVRGGNPQVALRSAILAAFLLPAIGILLILQRLARYRIPWPVELLALPFIAGTLIYAAAAIRSSFSS